MFEYDPTVNLRHYPTPMRKYGLNPFNEPLYRIVFRESRRHLVGGTWRDGSTGYHWVEKYRQVSSPWILERWYTAAEFTKMTKTQWDTQMVDPLSGWLVLGPYPSRGEYDMVWEFDAGGPANDSLTKIIGYLELGRTRSFQDIRDAHVADYEAETKAMRQNRYDDIRDGMTAFGSAPISAGRFGRGTKTTPELLTAEQCGLPTPKALPQGHGAKVGPLEVSTSLNAGVRV